MGRKLSLNRDLRDVRDAFQKAYPTRPENMYLQAKVFHSF